MVRRSRRVEGHKAGSVQASPAAGIQRFFTDSAGGQSSKMAHISEEALPPQQSLSSQGLHSSRPSSADMAPAHSNVLTARTGTAAVVSAGHGAPPPSSSLQLTHRMAASPSSQDMGLYRGRETCWVSYGGGRGYRGPSSASLYSFRARYVFPS